MMTSPVYRALLQGDRIEWIDEPPMLEGPVEVEITFPNAESADALRERRRMSAAALAEIADAGGIATIPDPLEWQREIRKDRPLPGREE